MNGINCQYLGPNELENFKAWVEVFKGKSTSKKNRERLESLEKNLTEEQLQTLLTILRTDFKDEISANFIVPDPKDKTVTSNIFRRELEQHIFKVMDVYEKEQKKALQAPSTASKIGSTDITIYSQPNNDKNLPKKRPTALYVFTENLQAFVKAFKGNIHNISYEEVEDPKINVTATSAALRTDNDGNTNPNVVPLVVKKSAQLTRDGETKFIGKNSSAEDIQTASFNNKEFEGFKALVDDFVKKIKNLLTPEIKYKWAQSSKNNYEVTDKIDASKAVFKDGTKFELYINGQTVVVNASNRSIEDIYQKDLKKYAKGSKVKAVFKSKDSLENAQYYKAYLPLWLKWTEQNPEMLKEIEKEAQGKVLTDKNAKNTLITPAKAFADILNGNIYEEIFLPESIALNNAGLPMNLAQYLQNSLAELGIATKMEESAMTKDKNIDDNERLYGLKTLHKQAKRRTASYDERNKEALESLNAEFPELPVINSTYNNILMKVLPDIYTRRSRINMLTEIFYDMIDNEINNLRNVLNQYSDSSLDIATIQVKKGLNSNKAQDRYKAAFSYRDASGKQKFLETILSRLNTYIDMFAVEDIQSIPQSTIDTFIAAHYNGQKRNFISRQYQKELSEVGEVDEATLKNRAINAITFFSQLGRGDGVREAVLDKVMERLDERYGIQIELSSNKIIQEESPEDVAQETLEEDADNRSGIGIVKWKIKDPIETVTSRIKNLLSNTYQTVTEVDEKTGVKHTITRRDDLGLAVPLKFEVAYFYLLSEFANMRDAADFNKVRDRAVEKYPWFREAAEIISNDSDLRNEFFRCMYNTLTTYARISHKGHICIENKGYDINIFENNVAKNYEGHLLLSNYSIYKADGTVDVENRDAWRDILKKGDFNKAINILSDKNSKLEKVKSVLKSLNKGDHNFTELLKSLAIDTEDFDLASIVPNLSDDTIDGINSYDELNQVWDLNARNKVLAILSNARQIIGYYGDNNQNNLIADFKDKYQTIAKNMVSTAQSYTTISFWDGEHQRNSYTKVDSVTRFVKAINGSESQEEIEEYLNREYLRFNFFRNGTRMLPLLRDFLNNKALRDAFTKLDILSSDVGQEKWIDHYDLGKMDRLDYTRTMLTAFFSKQATLNDENKTQMAYYGNPLYSDVETIQLFKLPKVTGTQYQEILLERLYETALAEIERISDFRKNKNREVINVDNFNSGKNNAGKFNLFPKLNPYVDEIVRRYDAITGNNDITIKQAKNELRDYLIGERGVLRQTIAESFEEWLGSFTEAQRLSFLPYTKEIEILDEPVDDNPADEPSEETQEEITKQAREKKERELDLEEIRDRMQLFFYNDVYTRTQLLTIFFGDLAYFKNSRDQIKRAKQLGYSAGEYVYDLEDDGTPAIERVIYLQDRVMMSKAFPSIKALLEGNVSNALKSRIEDFFSAYTDIISTDGQGFRTPKSMLDLFRRMGGVVTPEIEKAFNDLMSGNITMDCFDKIVNAIKPLLAGYEVKNVLGRLEKIPVQHKNSEYMLTAIYSALNTAFNKSPEYRALHHFMEVHNIDAAQFESCVKHGSFNPLNLNYSEVLFNRDLNNGSVKDAYDKLLKLTGVKDKNPDKVTYKKLDNLYKTAVKKGLIDYDTYEKEFINKYAFESTAEEDSNLSKRLDVITDEELNNFIAKHPRNALAALEKQMRDINNLGTQMNGGTKVENVVHEFPIRNIMLLQPSDDHLTDKDGLKGSQHRNILPADLPDYGDGPEGRVYAVTIGGETHMYTYKELNAYHDALVAIPTLEEFNVLRKIFTAPGRLRSYLSNEMKKNKKYNSDVKSAVLYQDGTDEFGVPFNAPILNNKLADLLLSPFKNHIQRQKIKGGNAVLVTSFSTDLRTEFKDGKPVSMECYLPAYSKDFINDYLVEQPDGSYRIDFDQLVKDGNEEVLKIIGYRIPTEQKYSMFTLKIVGFNPEIAGASITLPAEAVGMSGFDFDIDKLFLMIKEYRRSRVNSKMGLKALEWAEKNGKNFTNIASQLANYDEKSKKYTDRKKPFTVDEIAQFREVNKDFKEYYDSLGKRPMRYIPYAPTTIIRDEEGRIDLLATLALEDVKSYSERKKIRNNMYIDLNFDILSSKDAATLMFLPATYADAKVGSRVNMILNDKTALAKFFEIYKDKIDKIGLYEFMTHFGYYSTNDKENDTTDETIDRLDNFYETYGTIDEPANIRFITDSYVDLMQGSALIGVFAVNSSRHYKLQFANVTIKPNKQFSLIIDGKEYNISKVNPLYSPIDGNLLSFNLSQLQAASPDNGKDPVLGKLGISLKTAKETCYMASVGVPLELIGILNNAKDALEVKLEEPTEAEQEYIVENSNTLDVTKFINALTNYRLDNASREDLLTLVAFQNFWENKIMQPAMDYSITSAFIRADSPNGAMETTVADALLDVLSVDEAKEKMKSKDYSFDGLADVIDLDYDASQENIGDLYDQCKKAALPRLQAFYSCGIKAVPNLVKDYLPQFSVPFINMVKLFTNMRGYKINKSDLQTFLNDFTTYALSTCPLFTGNNTNIDDIVAYRNFFIKDFPMQFLAFLNEKNSKGRYKYKDIRNLTLIKLLKVNEAGIKIKNVSGSISSTEREYYTEAMDYMLQHKDRKVQDMAKGLAIYSFFDNGFNFHHSDFGVYFSNNFMLNIPEFYSSIKEGNRKVVENDTDFLNNYLYSFFLNNPQMLKTFNEDLLDGCDIQDTYVTIPVNPKNDELIRINNPLRGDNNEPLPMFRIQTSKNKRLYTLHLIESGDPSNYTYEIVTTNSTKDRIPFYHSESSPFEIPYKDLKKRGKVADPNKLLESVAKKKEKEEEKELTPADAERGTQETASTNNNAIKEIEKGGITIINNGGTVNIGNANTEKIEQTATTRNEEVTSSKEPKESTGPETFTKVEKDYESLIYQPSTIGEEDEEVKEREEFKKLPTTKDKNQYTCE